MLQRRRKEWGARAGTDETFPGPSSGCVVWYLYRTAHFLVRREGELMQLVPCTKRAWHAGSSSWRGRERCNDFSVGIELEGTDDSAFAAAQYLRLAQLARTLQYLLPISDIAGHSDVAPGRKSDPGVQFSWKRFLSDLARV